MRLVAYNSFQIQLFGFKESYDTNYIVPALPALCEIPVHQQITSATVVTTVLPVLPLLPNFYHYFASPTIQQFYQ